MAINNEVTLKKAHQVKNACKLTINLPEEKPIELIGHDFSVPIIYEDKQIAVIHKPARMTVHPGAGTGEDTLVHSLIAQLKKLSSGSEPDRPGIVHRLDRETEGLMVIARDDLSHARLASAFQNRQIKKRYKAWLWHKLRTSEGSLNGFIGRHPKKRKQMLFADEANNAGIAPKEAKLNYQLAKEDKYMSLVDIELITGRTHQIRAAFDSMGNAVVGDKIYGRQMKKIATLPASIAAGLAERGMLLIAYFLEFEHPQSRKLMSFELPLPKRFIF